MTDRDETGVVRATLTLAPLYVAVGKVLTEQPDYWSLSEAEFVEKVRGNSDGKLSPEGIARVYHELMQDAGVQPLSLLERLAANPIWQLCRKEKGPEWVVLAGRKHFEDLSICLYPRQYSNVKVSMAGFANLVCGTTPVIALPDRNAAPRWAKLEDLKDLEASEAVELSKRQQERDNMLIALSGEATENTGTRIRKALARQGLTDASESRGGSGRVG